MSKKALVKPGNSDYDVFIKPDETYVPREVKLNLKEKWIPNKGEGTSLEGHIGAELDLNRNLKGSKAVC